MYINFVLEIGIDKKGHIGNPKTKLLRSEYNTSWDTDWSKASRQ